MVEVIPDIWLAGYCTANKCGVRLSGCCWVGEAWLIRLESDQQALTCES